MNDTIIIAMPTWFYWYLVAWLGIGAIRASVNLLNEFLEWRINRSKT
jgi:hypothetical protein